MYTKKILTLEGVYAAAPATVFLTQIGDGSPNWDETNGVLTVFANSERVSPEGEVTEYTDKFDLKVKGAGLLTTVANQVSSGKGLDRVTCMVRTIKQGAIKADANGNPKKDKNTGKYDYVDLPVFHLKEIELGNDSEKSSRAALTKKYEDMVAQGTLPPNTPVKILVDAAMEVRKSKEKNKAFDVKEATAKGLWGHATLWDKVRGTWKPNGESKATAGSGQTEPQAPQMDLSGVDPDTVAAIAELLKNAKNSSPKATQNDATQAVAGIKF
jgi:hypothetical protein